jgi:GxxExxY protein
MIKINDLVYPAMSYKLIGILFEVYNNIGPGHKEAVYQRAIEVALAEHNISFKRQCPYLIRYKGNIVGRYFIDIIIENRIVIELKRGDYFQRSNIVQLYNYLKVTDMKLGLLVNFTANGLRFKRILNIN